MLNKNSVTRELLVCVLLALALVAAVFPDVVFKGASLRMTDQLVAAYYGGKELRPVYPIPEHSEWWGAYNDTGGAIFQSEPMVEFMRRTIATNDSPYWNPYAAGGAMGPESLVDLKFSVPTIVSALTGGTSLGYNISTLTFFALGSFFLLLTMVRVFEVSRISAVGATVFFLLNGYAIANSGSNIAQSYPFIPICLYAVLMHAKAPSALRFIALCLSFALVLTCTFMPTTIVSIIGIYVVALAYLSSRIAAREVSYRTALSIVAVQAFAGVMAFALLAFIYFPVLENLESTGLLKNYVARVYFPAVFPAGILALFSPSLFFESYNARETQTSLQGVYLNTVYHLGLVAFAMAGCALSRSKTRFRIAAAVCGLSVLFFLGNIYGIPILRPIVESLPIVGSIGNQYWWMSVVLPLTIMIGLGLDNVRLGRARVMPALLLLAVAIAAAIYLNDVYGLHEPREEFKKSALLWTGVLLAAIAVALVCARFVKNRLVLGVLAALFVATMFGELIASSKMVRYERSDYFEEPGEIIGILRKNAGLYRTANFSTTGLYPDLGSAFGIQEISSTNEGNLPYFRDYFYATFDMDPSQQFGYNRRVGRGPFPSLFSVQDAPEKTKIDWQAVDLLGIKYIITPSAYVNYRRVFTEHGLKVLHAGPVSTIYENPSVMPRAFVVPADSVDQKDEPRLLKDFRTVAVPVEIKEYRNAEVVLAGKSAGSGVVVLTDNWHGNWRATVNGVEAPVLRVDGLFRGVKVPAGDFRIEMTYRPKTLSLALYSSAIGCLLLLLLFIFRRRVDRFFSMRSAPVATHDGMRGVSE